MAETQEKRPLGITEVVLRDAHQSLLATRMRLEDMLPAAEKLDQVGYWSMESWGGATFDACIRYLGEDPWVRIRELKGAMPNTPQQMLLRGQNLLGYRHYADDVVQKFVERAAASGVDIFRIFDAMNDPRNLETALRAAVASGAHAQGTIAYTISPMHTLESWTSLARRIEDMGAHSLAIKDMAGLLTPYTAFELVRALKKALSIPIHMQSHATTGMSTATILKAVEAGLDNTDTAISSLSMTYGHSPTESIVSIFRETGRDTGLHLPLLEEIAAYFRKVRLRYARFEGQLRGVDSRILVAQVPGGMLTNMENQLKEQGALEKMDEVLQEIPRVREDLGFIPLVTPTSQIVGTQAVLNILSGERYKNISRETAAILRGEYGATPAPVDKSLQARVLEGGQPVSCRPADLLEPEMEKIQEELLAKAKEGGLSLSEEEEDDVLSYALFPQVALNFFRHRGDPSAFEDPDPAPAAPAASAPAADDGGRYTVTVEGRQFEVEVSRAGAAVSTPAASAPTAAAVTAGGQPIPAPLAGNIFRVVAQEGAQVKEGDVLVVLEAMKMETEVRSPLAGTLQRMLVTEGQAVKSGDTLAEISP